jgi:hypothetical protein
MSLVSRTKNASQFSHLLFIFFQNIRHFYFPIQLPLFLVYVSLFSSFFHVHSSFSHLFNSRTCA